MENLDELSGVGRPSAKSSPRLLWVRWISYGLAGVLFGVLDFYWEKGPSITLSTSGIGHYVFAWGFFLIPVVPLAIVEFGISKSKIKSALASSLIWSVAIVTFYIYQLFELVFIGKPSRIDMHISSSDTPYYLSNLRSVFENEVVEGIAEWIWIAILGGFIVGFCVSWLTSLLVTRRSKQK